MIGGAVGAALRYWVGTATLHQFGPSFPWGTLTVNLAGGFLMGLLAGGLVRLGGNESLRLLLGVGVLGGFTTFSAFSLDAVTLFERGHFGLDAAYVLASVAGSILALFLGLWIARVTA